jgi:hypothetical protein
MTMQSTTLRASGYLFDPARSVVPASGCGCGPIKRAYSRVSLTARASGSKVTRSSSDDRPARAQRANGFELALFARIFA